MLNKIIVMGRLTRDPELRHTQNNTPVCSFRIAVDRDRKSPNGERQTDFFDCVSWNKQAEFVSQWFTKGTMVIVVGRLQPRQWQDQNGNSRIAVEIQCDEVSFGETRKAREANGTAVSGPNNGGYNNNSGGGYNNNASYQAPPNRPAPPAQNAAPSFDLPADSSDFQEFDDSDEPEVPF